MEIVLCFLHGLSQTTEGEAVLLDHIPKDAKRILDLGTGDGRLIRLLKIDRANMEAVALDTSPTMLKTARQYFSNDSTGGINAAQQLRLIFAELGAPSTKPIL